MDIKTVEEISNHPANFSGAKRKEAWEWSDKKRLDKSVSVEYRQRAQVAFSKIFNWALSQINDGKYRAYD